MASRLLPAKLPSQRPAGCWPGRRDRRGRRGQLPLLLALLLALAPGRAAWAQPKSSPPPPAISTHNHLADSLLAALQVPEAGPGPDTARAKTALRLSAALAGTDTARAGRYARQALTLSTAAGFGYGQAHGWLQLSALALLRHDAAAARRYGARAAALAGGLSGLRPSGRVRRLRAGIANNQGSAAELGGQFAAAAGFYLQAAAWLAASSSGNRADAATLLTVYGNLGGCFVALGQPARAATYWRQAVALRTRTGPVPALLPAYLQLAALHLQRGQPDSAAQRLRAARPLLAGPGGLNSLYAGDYYGMLGQYQLQMRQPRPARQALNRALTYATAQGNAAAQARLLLGLGQLDEQLGDQGLARAHLLRSLALTELAGEPAQQLGPLEALGRLEEQAGQWQLALRYERRRQRLRDTLAGAVVRRQVNALEVQFRTRQQAQQLAALRRERQAQQQVLRQQRQLSTLYLVLLLTLAAAGALAFALRRHRRRLATQRREQDQAQAQAQLTTRAIVQGQEEERRRLARDLHDGLGGQLASVKLYLGAARRQATTQPAAAAALLAQSVEHLDGAIGELRQVARNLMPEALLMFGLAQALQDLCAAGPAAPAADAGSVAAPLVRLQVYGLDQRLPPATEVELFRLVQELLTNARRHAQARQVLVQLLRNGNELQLVVEDDGRGFEPATVRPGVGLRSIEARARYLGATLDVHSRPGQGTSVSLALALAPLAGGPAAPDSSPAPTFEGLALSS